MLKLKKLSLQASDEEDEPGVTVEPFAVNFFSQLLSVTGVISVSTVIPSKGSKKKVGDSVKFSAVLKHSCVFPLKSLSIFQLDNKFAALIQAQSDDEEETELPEAKVRCCWRTPDLTPHHSPDP